MDDGSRMTRECHVRFCEKLGVKLPRLTHHLNGYWLLYKRLESQRFHWPDWFDDQAVIELDQQQLDYLLDGYDLNGMRPHHEQHYAVNF